jgi:hypothetical protein
LESIFGHPAGVLITSMNRTRKHVLPATALLWAVSSLPGVAAERVCYETVSGQLVCRNRLPLAARIALGITSSVIFFLAIMLLIYVGRSRTESRVYNVEAAQMHGPPPIAVPDYSNEAEYHTPSAYYVPPRSPAYPARAVPHYGNQPQTAPVHGRPSYMPQTAPTKKVTFAEPDYDSDSDRTLATPPGANAGIAPPKTAFVSGRFPRPLYTGTGREPPPF